MLTDSARQQRQIAIIVTVLGSFNSPFMASSVNVALPSIGLEFQLEPLLLGWISTAYLLALAPFLISFGRLGDIQGHRKVFTVGLLIHLAASGLITFSASGHMIIMGRILQGGAYSMVQSPLIPMLLSSIPVDGRGKFLGITTASTYFGHSAGPFLGGIITHYCGWRYIFGLNIAMSLTTLALVQFIRKDSPVAARGEKFDFPGAAFLGSGILATMYGFSTLPALAAALLIAAGIISLTCFVFFEMRTPQPIIDINLFRRNTAFAFSNLAALIHYAATFAISFLLSLYLQKVKALTPEVAGLVLVSQPIVQAIFSPLAGWLSDRLEPRLLSTWGLACTFLGLVMLAFLQAASPLRYVVICQVIIGCGYALFSSPNAHAVMSSVDGRSYGIAMATLSTMRQVGNTFSMGLVMLVMSLSIGKAAITPAHPGPFIASMTTTFAVFALLCFGGIFASLARGNIQRGGHA